MIEVTNSVELWQRCLAFIRDNVQEHSYKTWFEPIVPYKYEDNTLYVKVPSQFFYEFLDENFVDLLRAALHKEIGPGTNLMYDVTVDKDGEKSTVLESSTRSTILSATPKKDERKSPDFADSVADTRDFDSHLNPHYNFHNFIQGNSNMLARTAGESVSIEPAKTFNPLFIWGASGVGKTHLVNAIGTRIKELHPEKRVLFTSAHLFQVLYTDSVRRNTTNDFIRFYQMIDVLIIDDIQEFAGVTKTQNTFFHIFNHLQQNGKQLILTADKNPIDLQGIEERLLTRFKWGLAAELEKPTVELRREILRSKIHRDGLTVPDNVVDFLAEKVDDSVRDLEGVLNSLMAHSTFVYNKEIDLDLAERIVKKCVRAESRKVTIDSILRIICEYYHIEEHVIHSRSRKRDIVNARQVAMFLAKKYTDESSSRIGHCIGQRDHATVIHACKAIQGQYDVDKGFQLELEEIEQLLKR